jgi:hypothetical protein
MESRAKIHLCPLMKTVNELIFYKTHAHSTTLCKELYTTFHKNLTNSLGADTSSQTDGQMCFPHKFFFNSQRMTAKRLAYMK